MAWVVGGLVAAVLLILAPLFVRDIETSFVRWVAGSATKRALIALILFISCVFVSGTTDAERRLARSPKPLSWDQRAIIEQARIDLLRIGMTEEEVRERLGPPSGRFAAPPNPYGIRTELVYSSDLTIVQLLLGEVSSVVYFSVTAVDVEFKLETPVRYYPLPEGSEPKRFVLNATRLAAVYHESVEPFGFYGASWMNFALVWGGSHAANWRYDAVGFHFRGEERRRGIPLPEDHDGVAAGLIEALMAAQQPEGGSPEDWEAEEARRRLTCTRELVRDAPNVSAEKRAWFERACASYKQYTDEQVARLRNAPAWSRFVEQATADTFATSAPDLFADYPAAVFFGIFDLGPTELSMP